MKKIETPLKDCYIIEPTKIGDERGHFSVLYKFSDYKKEFGFGTVDQQNESKSQKGVLRGLHFQKDPYSQAKIVRVISGAVLDVVVDMREDSPSFGKYFYVYLNHDNYRQLYVPRGFAHGFLSLEDDTEFDYLIDNEYAPNMEGGIIYNDPDIAIPWDDIFKEYGIKDIILSEKDTKHPTLKLCPTRFKRGK